MQTKSKRSTKKERDGDTDEMKAKRRKGRSVRTKGHSFERMIAKLLRPVFPNARRQLEYHQDDCNGVDIQNADPYLIQCKALKGYASINRLDEIKPDKLMGDVPILITKADNKPIMVVMPFTHFLSLLLKTRDTYKKPDQ